MAAQVLLQVQFVFATIVFGNGESHVCLQLDVTMKDKWVLMDMVFEERWYLQTTLLGIKTLRW